MTQILIPISENTKYFPKEEFFFPKPLVAVAGKPLIVHVIENLNRRLKAGKCIFVIPSEMEREFSLASILRLNTHSEVRIIERHGKTAGGLCSALMAIDHLDENEPLIIMNMDEIISWDLQSIVDCFVAAEVDAGIVTFYSTHPRWCYAKLSENKTVEALCEKRVVSNDALAGFYFFRNKEIFVRAASQAMLDGDSLDGLFYISAAINQILLADRPVANYTIAESSYASLFSPQEIHRFEEAMSRRAIDTLPQSSHSKLNLLIPAAGDGTRFAKQGWTVPKPLIEINGVLMLELVLANLNLANSNSILLLRSEHLNGFPSQKLRLAKSSTTIVEVAHLTEGSVCTVLLARALIDFEAPLLVANSDQIVDFDCNSFVNDCQKRNLDGSILVFKDASRDVKWSFVRVNANGLVQEVAEKQPISDLATVGIYYFSKGSDFVSAALDMIVRNDRVNGEFYTCPVYNYMIANGARIGVYEIPFEAMHGIGTPDDLEQFIALRGFSSSPDAPTVRA